MQTVQVYYQTDHSIVGTLNDSSGTPITTSTAVLSVYDSTDTLVGSAITASQSGGVYTFVIPRTLAVLPNKRYYGVASVTSQASKVDPYRFRIDVEYRE